MKNNIISKYSTPVPRYTSYPPANFFTEMSPAEYQDMLTTSNRQKPSHISFYIHIPFCMKLCHYCGCNAWLMQQKDTINRYISALHKEIKMVLPLISPERKISQIHYGGGTPTSLPVDAIAQINELLLSHFPTIENPEIAIECHPGYMDEKYWISLLQTGFNRISLGVQDFDKEVLKASNRKPSLLPIENVMEIIREFQASVNLDFIYGLPLQTVDTFSHTIEKAALLKPDRLVTFSYAHVPWINPNMKKLERRGLPSAEEKAMLFSTAKQILTQSAGYHLLGLDHFVRPNDELYLAHKQKLLRRNFQGYCTARTTGQVYAFGVTGISQLTGGYAQNVKNIEQYIQKISAGILPTAKGYRLSNSEQITKEVISHLMCNHEVQWSVIANRLDTTVEKIKNTINYNIDKLQELEADGIIEMCADKIVVKPEASIFVRNVAATLDRLLCQNPEQRFSKAI